MVSGGVDLGWIGELWFDSIAHAEQAFIAEPYRSQPGGGSAEIREGSAAVLRRGANGGQAATVARLLGERFGVSLRSG
jgi:hypothetical protein